MWQRLGDVAQVSTGYAFRGKINADDDGDTPFGGSTVGAVDTPRLTAQLERVRAVMAGGDWWTPEQLEAATGDRWASISARIRDLRKSWAGGHTVERERVKDGGGTFRYRLLLRAAVSTGGA